MTGACRGAGARCGGGPPRGGVGLKLPVGGPAELHCCGAPTGSCEAGAPGAAKPPGGPCMTGGLPYGCAVGLGGAGQRALGTLTCACLPCVGGQIGIDVCCGGGCAYLCGIGL